MVLLVVSLVVMAVLLLLAVELHGTKSNRQGIGAKLRLVAETARRTECQAEEFELVGRCARAFLEQFEALLAHLGVLFVGHQLDAIIERPDG